jgi:hypothetical protein
VEPDLASQNGSTRNAVRQQADPAQQYAYSWATNYGADRQTTPLWASSLSP